MENDLYQMQQEAARRVQHMQQQAQEQAQKSAFRPSPPVPDAKNSPEAQVSAAPAPTEPGLLQKLTGEQGGDGLLVLVLLLLLTEDGADPALLLAMLYLFL